MTSIDLSDPRISMAYDALVHNDPLRWFLLTSGNRPNELSLCASGTGDVDELRSHLTPGNVYYGIFREYSQDKSLHVSLNYIPDSVRGVWRARALVHAKAVSSKFKAHQALNVSNPDQLTVQALRSILRLPPRVPQGFSATESLELDVPPRAFSIPRKPTPDIRSFSISTPPNRTRSPSPTNDGSPYDAHIRSASSPFRPSLPIDAQPSSTPTPGVLSSNLQDSLSQSILSSPPNTSPPSPVTELVTSSLSEATALPDSVPLPLVHSPTSIESEIANGVSAPESPHSPQHMSWLAKQDSPLPPPPPAEYQDGEREPSISDERSVSSHLGSIPDSQSVASLDSSDYTPSPAPPRATLSHTLANVTSIRNAKNRRETTIDGLPRPSLTSPPQPVVLEEISRPHPQPPAKASTVGHSKRQETLAAPSKVRSKFQERAASGSPADVEEERKLAVLEEERRRRAAERARREKEERDEEEAREREFEERKEREKKRRLEIARKAEERRAEQKRQQEEEEARRKAEKERKEEEIRQKRNHIQERFDKRTGVDLLSGFITLESSSNWKRRYYRLSTEDWVFFKSDKEVTTPMHAIDLSRVRALREWHEGYDELEAIPHSFAVELKDDAPWLFFADSAEDKEILLGLLNQAAGL